MTRKITPKHRRPSETVWKRRAATAAGTFALGTTTVLASAPLSAGAATAPAQAPDAQTDPLMTPGASAAVEAQPAPTTAAQRLSYAPRHARTGSQAAGAVNPTTRSFTHAGQGKRKRATTLPIWASDATTLAPVATGSATPTTEATTPAPVATGSATPTTEATTPAPVATGSATVATTETTTPPVTGTRGQTPIGDESTVPDPLATTTASPSPVTSSTTDAPNGPWTSGAYLGGLASAQTAQEFGAWRGHSVGAVVTFPVHSTWQQMSDSQWNISTFNGFNGDLVVSVPLLPLAGGSLKAVANGEHDGVFRKMAQDLVDNNRQNSAILRIGWEANGSGWFPWGADASSANDYKAAYRHVAQVMQEIAPNTRTNFDINCGSTLAGSSDRMASLNELYPGDDVVDIVGCDSYDMWTLGAKTPEQWQSSLRPKHGPGLSDVVEFARARGKKWSVPEWGLVSQGEKNGNGDNPYYIDQMQQFFAANSHDLAFEAYFNAQGLTDSTLWQSEQYPNSVSSYTTK